MHTALRSITALAKICYANTTVKIVNHKETTAIEVEIDATGLTGKQTQRIFRQMNWSVEQSVVDGKIIIKCVKVINNIEKEQDAGLFEGIATGLGEDRTTVQTDLPTVS